MSATYAKRVNEIRTLKAKQYGSITLSLSTARNNEELGIQGNLIYVDALSTLAVCYVKLNEISADNIPLKIFRELTGCYYRVFISNPAQAGSSITFFYSLSENESDNDFSIKDYFLATGASISEVSTVVKDTSDQYYTGLGRSWYVGCANTFSLTLYNHFSIVGLVTYPPTPNTIAVKINRIKIISTIDTNMFISRYGTAIGTDYTEVYCVNKIFNNTTPTTFQYRMSKETPMLIGSKYNSIFIPAKVPIELIEKDVIQLQEPISNLRAILLSFGLGAATQFISVLFDVIEVPI